MSASPVRPDPAGGRSPLTLRAAVIDHRFADLDPERGVLASVPAAVDDLKGLPEEEAKRPMPKTMPWPVD